MKPPLLYVFVFLLVLSCKNESDDYSAIKKVLEKESATWRSGDIKNHAACWKVQPYSRILVSTGDGRVIDVPPENMINPPGQKLGDGGSSTNSNYKMKITGNSAWVSHNEESISREGKKTNSYEIRLLEKINNEWKLVGQSIHILKPE